MWTVFANQNLNYALQTFLNQHCGELVSVCEAYLSGVILNENGAQNLNEDLVVREMNILTESLIDRSFEYYCKASVNWIFCVLIGLH